jgi:CRP-like cAMP-binding protein
MPLTDRARKLCTIPLFKGLDEDALNRICGLMTEFEAPAGMILMQRDAPGSGLLLVDEGTVVVSTRNGDIEVGSGECLGELALLDERGKHAARARAKTEVKGFAIDRSHFTDMLEAEPKIALALLHVLAHRLADAIHR